MKASDQGFIQVVNALFAAAASVDIDAKAIERYFPGCHGPHAGQREGAFRCCQGAGGRWGKRRGYGQGGFASCMVHVYELKAY